MLQPTPRGLTPVGYGVIARGKQPDGQITQNLSSPLAKNFPLSEFEQITFLLPPSRSS